MTSQVELRAIVPDELLNRLEEHFFEMETSRWGILSEKSGSPYQIFGFFPDETIADRELEALRRAFPSLPESFERGIVEDRFWQNAYKTFVKPWNSGRLHWIPLWERDTIRPPEGAATVYIDAGMAFGTGAHATTRLCACRLTDYLKDRRPESFDRLQIIDAGCGSGILTLSAAALGSTHVFGFDSDPEAIRVCHENVRMNRHLPDVDFQIADLKEGLENRRADFLMANIQTDVLTVFSDSVVTALKSGGTLALSGILTGEIRKIRNHYESRFAQLRPEEKIHVDTREDGDWGDLRIRLV